jgi:hypothetical protein
MINGNDLDMEEPYNALTPCSAIQWHEVMMALTALVLQLKKKAHIRKLHYTTSEVRKA